MCILGQQQDAHVCDSTLRVIRHLHASEFQGMCTVTSLHFYILLMSKPLLTSKQTNADLGIKEYKAHRNSIQIIEPYSTT